jgi:hypothetical protein
MNPGGSGIMNPGGGCMLRGGGPIPSGGANPIAGKGGNIPCGIGIPRAPTSPGGGAICRCDMGGGSWPFGAPQPGGGC